MKASEARKFLEDVIAMKQAVPFRDTVKEPVTGKPMAEERYPVSASKEILKVLKNAEKQCRVQGS